MNHKKTILSSLAVLSFVVVSLFIVLSTSSKENTRSGTPPATASGSLGGAETRIEAERYVSSTTSVPNLSHAVYSLGRAVNIGLDADRLPQSDEDKELAKSTTIRDVYNRYRIGPINWAELRGMKSGSPVGFPLPGGGVAQGIVNLVELRDGEPFGIGGALVSGIQGSFSLVQDPLNGLSGALIPSTGDKAYVFSEENGETFMDVVPKGSVLCEGLPRGREIVANSILRATTANAPIPELNSRPEAAAVLYLDFDGETVTSVYWNAGATINALAPSFSTSDRIIKIWQEVSKDYAPFNINVTTVLAKYESAEQQRRMRVIITPTNFYDPRTGGVAYRGSFRLSGTVPCWVFNGASDLDVESNSHMCAMSISHELGHTFGLRHDGLLPATPDDGATSAPTKEPYYKGHVTPLGGWGPIMGAPFDKPIVQWSQDSYQGLHFSDPTDLNYYQGNNPEDDVSIIAGNVGVGAATDDYANTADQAVEIPQTPIASGSISVTGGLISSDADVDIFRIPAVAGPFSVTALNSDVYPNLKIKLTLFNPDQSINCESSSPTSLGASLSATVVNGIYYLKVEGVGTTGDKNTRNGFVGYGSIGKYSLTGSFRYLPHPAGDYSFDPIQLPGSSTFSVTTSSMGADSEVGEPGTVSGKAYSSIWFKYVAPGVGKITISTQGSTFDTVLSVFTGSPLKSLTKVAANNDAATGLKYSQLTFNAVSGVAYYFVVDGFTGPDRTGSIQLTGQGNLITSAPINDNLLNAQSVGSGNTFTRSGSILNATAQSGEPALAGLSATRSVWFTYTAPANGRLVVDTVGSDFNSVLGVYSGTVGVFSSLKLLAANDDIATGNLQSSVSLPVTSGTTYIIKVDGRKSSSGSYTLRGTFSAPLPSCPAPAMASFTMTKIAGTTTYRPSVTWSVVTGPVGYPVTAYEVQLIYAGQAVVNSGSLSAATLSYTSSTALTKLGYTARVRAIAGPITGAWREVPAKVSP